MLMILSKGKFSEKLVSSDRFIGSVHTTFELADGEEYVLFLPVRFAWNSIAIKPVDGATFTIDQTLSEPEAIGNGTAHWLQLADAQARTTELFYIWEHPIKAFKFSGTGTIHLDMSSKQE